MWHKTISIESLQLGAILTFMKFVQDQNPQNTNGQNLENSPDDIAALRMMLPLKDVEMIIRDMSCNESETDSATFFALELDSPEKFNTKLKSIVAELVQRLMSNMLAFAAKRDIVDVAFDDDNGFMFSFTAKAKEIYRKICEENNDSENSLTDD